MLRALLATLVLVGCVACGNVARDEGGMGSGGARGSWAASGAPGTGAPGKSSLQTAVAECEQFCETQPYRLPGALCEDWNRPGWDPEFCQLSGETESCADYCSMVYQTVNPACAAVLPAAIRCVAPTYASLTLPAQCWLHECRNELYTMTSACYGLQRQLAAARATWAASGVSDYELDYVIDAGSEVRVVVNGSNPPVVTPAHASAWTVPLLFDAVEHDLQSPGVTPSVAYDPALGYVVSLALLQGCEQPSTLQVLAVVPLH